MFINYPIYLWSKKSVSKEVPIEEEEEEEAESLDYEEVIEPEEGEETLPSEAEEMEPKAEEEVLKDEEEEEEEKEPKTKRVKEDVWDWDLMNKNKAIWLRNKDEIEDSEYKEFYKALSGEYQEPLAYEHFTVEGEIMFRALLYVPASAPFDIF
mmetsp:Transcript_22141/g.10525  ORF Transcript_22141/g.10525 Transcript_22141/m.10525 type:complete len:153 (+) Transcript_22141:531-989(+)